MDLDIGDITDLSASHSFALVAVVTTVLITIVGIRSHLAARPWTSKRCNKRLEGKTAIITGATGGLGKAVAIDLAKRGARIILPCRDENKGLEVAKSIHQKTANYNVVVHQCDLASLASIRSFVSQIEALESRVDILINSADGAASYLSSEQRHETKDCLEMLTGIKYFGHFLLSHLLMGLMKTSSPARIVNLVCLDYCHDAIDFDNLRLMDGVDFDPWKAHFRASLSMVLFTKEFGRRFKDSGITCNMVQPGAMDTNHGQLLKERYPHMPEILTPEEGAETVLYCALEKSLENTTGSYFSKCTMRMVAPHAQDEEVASKLWDITEKMVGLK